MGLRFMIATLTEASVVTSYLDENNRQYVVTKSDISGLDCGIGQFFVIWYVGTAEDQTAIVNLTSGISLLG